MATNGAGEIARAAGGVWPGPNANTIGSNWLQGLAADSVGDFAVLYGGRTDHYRVAQPTVQRYTRSGAANGNAITVASTRLLNYDSAIGG